MFFLPTPGNKDWPFPIPRTKKARDLIHHRPRRLQKYTDKEGWDLAASGGKQGTRESGETEVSESRDADKERREILGGVSRAAFWRAGWGGCSPLEWTTRCMPDAVWSGLGITFFCNICLFRSIIIRKVLSQGLHRIWGVTEAKVISKAEKEIVINKGRKNHLYHGPQCEQWSPVDSTEVEGPDFIYKMFPLLRGCLETQFHSTPTSVWDNGREFSHALCLWQRGLAAMQLDR